jgi:soluble lytic murein transglycosylase
LRGLLALLAGGLLASQAPPAAAFSDAQVLDARDAARRGDRPRLFQLRQAAEADGHPLAGWVAYWELSPRLGEAQAAEVDAFLSRWAGSYVEDRLRNDWLLELGRRRDWDRFAQVHPGFRMRDDRDVACYALLTRHLRGENVRSAALAAWWDQRDADDACNLLATALRDARQLQPIDIWRRLRVAVEANKPRQVQQVAVLLGGPVARQIAETLDNPARTLTRQRRSMGSEGAEVAALALIRLAAQDPDAAARELDEAWQTLLPREAAAWVWATIGRQAALRLQPQAADHFDRAWAAWGQPPAAAGSRDEPSPIALGWSDDTLAWQVRAAIRQATADGVEPPLAARRWQQVLAAIAAMSPARQDNEDWVYWRARALLALPAQPVAGATAASALSHASGPAAGTGGGGTAQAGGPPPGSVRAGDTGGAPGQRAAAAPSGPAPALNTHQEARALLQSIAGPFTFYGLLAAEDLGRPATLPARVGALTPAELARARQEPGLARALLLFDLNLRSEAIREWNFTIGPARPGGLSDRELLAAAELACERQIWDRCINTSDRTRTLVDLTQRYPLPYRSQLLSAAREARLDPAYLYGLIRQESRFLPAARSHVGASGLMQVMPATATWTARKLGIAYTPDQLQDPQTNIRLGVGYLKLVLDNLGGAQALAAAGYNAGPRRPQRWREGPTIDAAAWVENIPFSETRDYVKKVLANAEIYAGLISNRAPALRARLGERIGPTQPRAPAADPNLP